MATSSIALLVLGDGIVLKDRAWGAKGRTLGEIVFSAGITDCQETLTDPSYHRQTVVTTALHISSTGVNDEDPESSHIWVAGFVVCDAARRASNWCSRRELEDGLISQGTTDIADVDTHAITRHTRERGTTRADTFLGNTPPVGVQYLRDEAVASLMRIAAGSSTMSGATLTVEVSTDGTYMVEPLGDFEGEEPIARIAVVGLGIKPRTPYHLAAYGARAYVVPSIASFAGTETLKPDGVFFSDGPGDSSIVDREIGVLRIVLDAGIPCFGICFGRQLSGRAPDYDIYKLDHNHRGINQPVKETVMGRAEITVHNHGFAVNVPVGEPSVALFESDRYGRVGVSYVGLNDGVVEGLRALNIPALSAQYHPEAAADPHDGELLFDHFISLITAAKETR